MTNSEMSRKKDFKKTLLEIDTGVASFDLLLDLKKYLYGHFRRQLG